MNKVKVQMLEPKEGIRTIDTTGGIGIAKPNVICRFILIVKRDDEVIEQRISDNEDYIKTEIFALKTLYSKYKNCSFWYGVLNGI